MNKHKKIISIMLCMGLLALSLLPVLGAGCPKPTPTTGPTTAPTTAPTPTSAPKHIVIGSVEPITGPISVVGVSQARAYELYIDMINKQGGLKLGNETYLFDYFSEDGKAAPDAAGTAANKLVNEDGATFVFGEILESATAAIQEVCGSKDVMHIITWCNIPGDPSDISPDKPLEFRLSPTPAGAQVPFLDYIKKVYPDAKTIAVAAPDIGYEGMIEELKQAASERGMEVTYVDKWAWGTEDFVPTYTQVLASKPDVIWAMISGQSQFQLKAARQLGFKGVFVSDGPADADIYATTAGPEYATDLICNSVDSAHATDAMKDVIARWQAKYSDPFVSYTYVSWDEIWAVFQAMEKAQSVDPIKVAAALESMNKTGDVQTLYGPGYIGGLKTYGCNRMMMKPVPVCHVMNGQTVYMEYVLPSVE